jgi:hypothetical protein
MKTPVHPSTHVWRGWTTDTIGFCACGKQTTGSVKNVKTGKTKTLCSDCAAAKGFK